MAIDPLTRTKIEAELRLGKTSRELSEKYDVQYNTINGWKKALDKERANEDIDGLLQYDEVTLHTVATKLKEEGAIPVEVKKVEKLVSDVDGLKRLGEKTRELSMTILNKTQAIVANESCSLKELREAANIVTTIHNAMFNKNTTQVNVLNNNTTNISGEKLDLFKSSLKA